MCKILSDLHRKIRNVSISVKIVILFVTLSCVSLALSLSVNSRLYEDQLRKNTEVMAVQNLDAVTNSFDLYINTIDRLSFIVLFDEQTQNMLISANDSNYFNETAVTGYVNKLLISVKKQTDDIASFYLFNNQGYRFFRKDKSIDFMIQDIREASWYEEVVGKDGALTLKINGGGDLVRRYSANTSVSYDDGFLSLIRAVNSIDTMQRIGISIINVEYGRIHSFLADMLNKNELDLCIFDSQGRILTDFSRFTVSSDDFSKARTGEAVRVTNDHQQAGILTMRQLHGQDLQIACITPIREGPYSMGNINVIIIIGNIVMMSLGGLLIFHIMLRPINDVLSALKEVSNNHFVRIEGNYGNDEFGRLKDGYNHMVSEIERLIGNIVNEQELKRKLELQVLMAQVNPHFLYNTFDCISSLALKNNETQIYSLLSALGEYYKKTLSKGDEIIPLKDEIQIARSYATIQMYRYNDLLTVSFDVDESISDVPVPKLVLQPLLENAIIHGIIPKGVEGNVWIKAGIENKCVRFSVVDDGVGMTPEQLSMVQTPSESNVRHFGIYNIQERLYLFYGRRDLMTIDVTREEGISVSILIPLDDGESVAIC